MYSVDRQDSRYPVALTTGQRTLGIGTDSTECSGSTCDKLCENQGIVNAGTSCGTNQVYMGLIPADPQSGTHDYVYHSKSVSGGADCTSALAPCGSWYVINFDLEGTTAGLPAGARTATPNGIQ